MNMKLRKLALYLQKDESEFVAVVRENPDKKVRELLELLGHSVDEERIAIMKKKFKMESKIAENWL